VRSDAGCAVVQAVANDKPTTTAPRRILSLPIDGSA
jgi:hypothetical protein